MQSIQSFFFFSWKRHNGRALRSICFFFFPWCFIKKSTVNQVEDHNDTMSICPPTRRRAPLSPELFFGKALNPALVHNMLIDE